ncbi:SDR family NAD(P)-dependent oxidoreductase [Nocardia cyriacigeorgica]|uniref:SDR family NAD(P)-dependent oxidoreductase n=1 Tax=Nocardia cyriacigeorgica TaxID=135487 RepID=A0A6P1D9L9_9NOCA|nr:SDR family NAD(P)-dependent oxidoreductase [Nocardia cyriacigeorgica]NEW39864.1 SDR family NAD(P)-dependent oxidoreductase [Nocardia cyriacigeorgica]NEW47187.1 SDR family NAD(P)-dependent oxidoreductase [Nocardia cyriacigeorgica]NEW55432.1 SDR family NAD(P)-dependent oxidoreductase [Nocardia cyriacigeorgica]
MRLFPFGGDRRTANADAVVTGAGSGIGRAFAVELGRRGGRVVCSDIDHGRVDETAGLVEAAGGKAIGTVCDVSAIAEVDGLAATAQDWFAGAPTLVVNNAGIGAGGPVVGEFALDDWHRTLDVNLWGVIHGCHVFAPILRTAGRGAIVNVASAAAFGAAPRMAAYNVSKAGVLALSETLSAELAGTGVGVTVLCPTGVKTNIMDADSPIDETAERFGGLLLRWTGRAPAAIARTALDAVDHGELYVVPQLEAKMLWQAKRWMPATYTRSAGLLGRVVR